MARLVRQRELSPVELVESHLERIEALDPRLHAFVGVDADGARAAACAAEASVPRREPLGPLHGVPLSMKSTVEVAGQPWDLGSRSRDGVRGQSDALVVRRAKAAGAIVLGVTNVAEQLMAWETDNALSTGGPTRRGTSRARPGDRAAARPPRLPRGSRRAASGATAADSIRVPAHFSGICGLKPTPGRVPATGHFPPCGGPFSLTGVVGPMARTVDDLELLLGVMAGPDIGDPNAHPVPLEWRWMGTDPGVGTDPLLGSVPPRCSPNVLRVASSNTDGRHPRPSRHPRRRPPRRRGARGRGRRGRRVATAWLDEARALWWEFFGRALRLLLEPAVAGHERDVHPLLVEFVEWAAARRA